MRLHLLLLCAGLLVAVFPATVSGRIAVGAAKIDITPYEPVVLAGYGSRKTPFTHIDSRLWARALVLGDKSPVALVVIDNCGATQAITSRLAKRLKHHGISADRLVVAATHTHNAPALVGYAPILWQGRISSADEAAMGRYTSWLIGRMEEAVIAALRSREQLLVHWTQGRVTFGGNRRMLAAGQWRGFGFQRSGPVDHSLPIMVGRDETGAVRFVWANYACHCTTVGSRNSIGGDWAGYAAEELERRFPKATALISIGCGADVGPQPTGTLELARQHGAAIGEEVSRAMTLPMKELGKAPVATTTRIQLPLEKPKPASYWESQQEGGGFHGQLASRMLRQLREQGKIPDQVNYPISAWKFGDELLIVFLAGEVVVDYSVRLKRELDWSRFWVNGWSNDMPGYIPSRRVLAEGGYEAEFSQVYYGLPGRYEASIEDRLVDAVKQLAGRQFLARSQQTPAPFHQVPSGDEKAFEDLVQWARDADSKMERAAIALFRRHLKVAEQGVESRRGGDDKETEWFDFAGDLVARRFIRQETQGSALRWRSKAPAAVNATRALLFSGGVGWQSQPTVGGFEMSVSGFQIKFDVVRNARVWKTADGKAQLAYIPTWTSAEDSAGFFLLVLPRDADAAPVDVEVRACGLGSKRWFAIDIEQDFETRRKSLTAALHSR